MGLDRRSADAPDMGKISGGVNSYTNAGETRCSPAIFYARICMSMMKTFCVQSTFSTVRVIPGILSADSCTLRL